MPAWRGAGAAPPSSRVQVLTEAYVMLRVGVHVVLCCVVRDVTRGAREEGGDADTHGGVSDPDYVEKSGPGWIQCAGRGFWGCRPI